jgi:hypothetical protein
VACRSADSLMPEEAFAGMFIMKCVIILKGSENVRKLFISWRV